MRPIGKRRPPSRHGPGWLIAGLLVAGILLVAAAWLAFGDSIRGSQSDDTERFVEADVGTPSRVNPLFSYLNDTDQDLVSLVFSGLTRLSQNGTVLPDLATNWDIGEGGNTVTFHLRTGVTFHNGAPFSSADVVFTYDLLADPKLLSDPEQAPLWRQVHCSGPDPLTVVCQLPAPFAPFLAYASIGILPKSALEGVDAATVLDSPFNQSPVGTGPYRLAQLAGSRAVLKAHAAYHQGLPLIDEIDLQFYPDPAGAAAAVLRGDAQAILVDSSIGEKELEELNSASGLKAYSANRTAFTALYMNNGKPPLNEEAVRRAVSKAVDIDKIVGDVIGGFAARATSPVIPGTWAYNPNVKPYEHDDGDARNTLNDAGWVLPEGSDVRVKNDTRLAITLLADHDAIRSALADRLAEDLRDVGFEVTVQTKDSASLVSDFLIPRDYQAAVFGWDQGLDPDPYPAWHSSQAGGNGRNLSEYQSQDADSVMEQARRSFDLDQRQSLYYTFQETFRNDVPSLVLYYPRYTYFVKDNIKGVEPGTMFSTGSRFRSVYRWKIEEAAPIGG